jgi:hypothetical protein
MTVLVFVIRVSIRGVSTDSPATEPAGIAPLERGTHLAE